MVGSLFSWYIKTLTKHHLDDSDELITECLIRASNKGYNKNQTYNLLVKNGIDMTPKATEELFSKFDQLLRESNNL